MTPTEQRTPRTGKDWLLDVALFLGAAAYGIVVSGFAVADPEFAPGPTLFTLDQIVGVLACMSLWWRRRWPLQLSIALTVVAAFSETSSGAMVIALFSVASYRGLRAAVAVFALSVLSALISVTWRIEVSEDRWVVFATGCLVHVAAAGWGVALHQRRSLILALRERAEQAEAEVEFRAEQVRRENRDAIARDIHDALGHRLSLLSVHAGALEYRTNPQPEEVSQAVQTIRRSAHEALQDLRRVIGVLRAPAVEESQPVLRHVAELAEQARETGIEVAVKIQVTGEPAEAQQETIYRIVQEGLTNARKHAEGSNVEVLVEGAPEAGVHVSVSNAATMHSGISRRTATEDGQGLIGLGERVAHLRGYIEYGPVPDRSVWEVSAWLPWTP